MKPALTKLVDVAHNIGLLNSLGELERGRWD
jgi:hypothetical protein